MKAFQVHPNARHARPDACANRDQSYEIPLPPMLSAAAALAALLATSAPSFAQSILKTAGNYSVLASQAITVAGAGFTITDGNIGLFPAATSNITGFPPGTVSGTTLLGHGRGHHWHRGSKPAGRGRPSGRRHGPGRDAPLPDAQLLQRRHGEPRAPSPRRLQVDRGGHPDGAPSSSAFAQGPQQRLLGVPVRDRPSTTVNSSADGDQRRLQRRQR